MRGANMDPAFDPYRDYGAGFGELGVEGQKKWAGSIAKHVSQIMKWPALEIGICPERRRGRRRRERERGSSKTCRSPVRCSTRARTYTHVLIHAFERRLARHWERLGLVYEGCVCVCVRARVCALHLFLRACVRVQNCSTQMATRRWRRLAISALTLAEHSLRVSFRRKC